MAHFFERPKKRAAKKVARHTALRLALRLSPRNEFKLARSAGSDRNSFSSWLRLRTQDDEPRKAGGHYMMIRTVAPSPGSREPTDLRTFPPAHLRTFRPSHLHTFTPPYRVKPKIGAKERERCCRSFMAHFFERPKKRAAKKVARHTALRLALRLSPRNEFKLARSAGSDRNSFSSWLRLRTQDDESRMAGGYNM